MKKQQNIHSTSFIHKNTEINGNIHSEGNLHISGCIKGQVAVNTLLILDKTGTIIGNLSASDAKISGNIEGELRITGMLTLLSGAKISGNIFAKQLVTEAGAIVDGELRVGKNTDVQKGEIITALPYQKKAG